MLSKDRLTLAIDIQSRSYKLLRWVGKAMDNGYIPTSMAREYTDISDSVFDWIERDYFNFPPDIQPDRKHFREFANFFASYMTTSFDVIENPGFRSVCNCGFDYCFLCTQLVNIPHLRAKKLYKSDKRRAVKLMVDRLNNLALEEGLTFNPEDATKIVEHKELRRSVGYSTYGYWLIKRMEGHSDGESILALWREIAWLPAGSPIKNFKLKYKHFVDAENALVDAMRTSSL